jgi:hypothetical protein
VPSAAWVRASAPSKVPFHVAGGSLAGWAVLLGAIGLPLPEFPGWAGVARLVMLTMALLVAATIVATMVTAGEEGEGEHASPAGTAARPSALQLPADPAGKLAFDESTRKPRRAGWSSRWSTDRRFRTTRRSPRAPAPWHGPRRFKMQ